MQIDQVQQMRARSLAETIVWSDCVRVHQADLFSSLIAHEDLVWVLHSLCADGRVLSNLHEG